MTPPIMCKPTFAPIGNILHQRQHSLLDEERSVIFPHVGSHLSSPIRVSAATKTPDYDRFREAGLSTQRGDDTPHEQNRKQLGSFEAKSMSHCAETTNEATPPSCPIEPCTNRRCCTKKSTSFLPDRRCRTSRARAVASRSSTHSETSPVTLLNNRDITGQLL